MLTDAIAIQQYVWVEEEERADWEAFAKANELPRALAPRVRELVDGARGARGLALRDERLVEADAAVQLARALRLARRRQRDRHAGRCNSGARRQDGKEGQGAQIPSS